MAIEVAKKIRCAARMLYIAYVTVAFNSPPFWLVRSMRTHKKPSWAFRHSFPDTERCVRDIAHLDLELGELEKKEGGGLLPAT